MNLNDGGFYLSRLGGLKDPDDPESVDKENVGIYRIQVSTRIPGHAGLGFHDIAIHIRKTEDATPFRGLVWASAHASFVASTPLDTRNRIQVLRALDGSHALTKTRRSPTSAGAEYVSRGSCSRGCGSEAFGEFPGSYSGARSRWSSRSSV